MTRVTKHGWDTALPTLMLIAPAQATSPLHDGSDVAPDEAGSPPCGDIGQDVGATAMANRISWAGLSQQSSA